MDYEQRIRTAIQEIKDVQMQKLQQLYAMDPAALRKVERSKLIELCADPDWAAADTIPNVLSAVGVSHSYSSWAKIKEQLPPLSYLFIDWNSAQPAESGPAQSGYQTSVSSEEQKALNEGLPVVVAGGTLVAGTVAVISLIAGGSVAVTVVSVLATLTGGLVLKKIYDDQKDCQGQSSKLSSTPGSSRKKDTDMYSALIRAAYKANTKMLENWCDQLLSATLAVCKEALQ